MSDKYTTQNEMRRLFKKHKLSLSFPNNAETGEHVTDWSYLYGLDNYENSELKKFREIIETEYADKYEVTNSGMMCTLFVKKIC